MPNSAHDVQRRWLADVLGILFGDTADGVDDDFPKQWAAAMDAWRDGIEQVDKDIGALGKHLSTSDDERLRKIAETGLNAITDNHKVRAMAALMDVSLAAADARVAAAEKAEPEVVNFLVHLSQDQRVAACDGNPFGVTVNVRDTLVPILQRLEGLLVRAAAH